VIKYLPWVALAALHCSRDRNTRQFLHNNAWIQVLLFFSLAHTPCAVTGVMSWVDLAWPTGLVALGTQVAARAAGKGSRKGKLAALMYILQGGRLMLGAVALARKGHFRKDLPRYKYQYEKRWKGISPGTWRFALKQHADIFAQCLANVGALAVPGALILHGSSDEEKDGAMGLVEASALVLWLCSFSFEHVSDMQKAAFVQKRKKDPNSMPQFISTGLWSLSRHPNYLGELGAWCSLTLLALPAASAVLTKREEHPVSKMLWGVGLASVPLLMHACLTWWTGAIPAEYYSKRKRAGYSDYMKRVPMLFPKVFS